MTSPATMALVKVAVVTLESHTSSCSVRTTRQDAAAKNVASPRSLRTSVPIRVVLVVAGVTARAR